MNDLGFELELAVLFVVQTLGHSIFAPFEVETSPWRKIRKWLIVAALTLAVYRMAGHWALLVPLVAGLAGGTFHFIWCRRNNIDPWRATPRRRYYELRGWSWPE